jgi:methionyl-tRNA synthetase
MFIINTTIPYINGDPHLGHLLEAVVHDSIYRYQNRLQPGQVIFSMELTSMV